MMTKQRLKKPSRRREKTLAELRAENIRLKKMIARAQRKAEHKCADASCLFCDPEQPGDGTWELI